MLDLLGDDSKVHRPRQLDHCCDHFLIDSVGLQVLRVSAINLQVIDWQMFETGEGTETTAEIVQREFSTNTMQDFNKTLSLLNV